jgi:ABC-type phosphate transport system substrate-binding protein
MKNMKHALLAAAAVVGSVGLAGSASAQSANQAIYGGGSTLASKVYRQLFDCWGVAITRPVLSCRSLIGNTSAGTVQILYAPVGSGAGKRAFDDHESGLKSYWQGLGIPAASNQVPYVSADFPAYFY